MHLKKHFNNHIRSLKPYRKDLYLNSSKGFLLDPYFICFNTFYFNICLSTTCYVPGRLWLLREMLFPQCALPRARDLIWSGRTTFISHMGRWAGEAGWLAIAPCLGEESWEIPAILLNSPFSLIGVDLWYLISFMRRTTLNPFLKYWFYGFRG